MSATVPGGGAEAGTGGRVVQRLCVIGVGLIGGSLARAARAADACGEIIGAGRDPRTLERALALGVVDRAAPTIEEGVAAADMVVIAVPLGATAEVLERVAAAVPAAAVITDVGSAKGSVVAAARAALGQGMPRFVPGHPIAGTERSGVEAGFAELFRGRRVVLTPVIETDATAVARVRALWQRCGAEVLEMDVARHDQVLAMTSHLPHMLAYALVDRLARTAERETLFGLAAGGFYDFTRIASSDPRMWHDICLANQDALHDALALLIEDLQDLAAAIEQGDSDRLFATFQRAKGARDAYMPRLNRGGERS